MTNLYYERAAMRGEQIPNQLIGADVLAYYALCYIYEQYKNGNISKNSGSMLKRKVVDAHKHTCMYTVKYDGMWTRIEESARNFKKETTIENAKKFYNAVYGLPEEGSQKWNLGIDSDS